MTKLTTHVLDTSSGLPAERLVLDLYRITVQGKEILITSRITNPDGRVDHPLLENDDFILGTYRIDFHVGDYLASYGGSGFLNIVPVRFIISDLARHYHVPLLLSPMVIPPIGAVNSA